LEIRVKVEEHPRPWGCVRQLLVAPGRPELDGAPLFLAPPTFDILNGQVVVDSG
jgi:hypothetical protein